MPFQTLSLEKLCKNFYELVEKELIKHKIIDKSTWTHQGRAEFLQNISTYISKLTNEERKKQLLIIYNLIKNFRAHSSKIPIKEREDLLTAAILKMKTQIDAEEKNSTTGYFYSIVGVKKANNSLVFSESDKMIGVSQANPLDKKTEKELLKKYEQYEYLSEHNQIEAYYFTKNNENLNSKLKEVTNGLRPQIDEAEKKSRHQERVDLERTKLIAQIALEEKNLAAEKALADALKPASEKTAQPEPVTQNNFTLKHVTPIIKGVDVSDKTWKNNYAPTITTKLKDGTIAKNRQINDISDPLHPGYLNIEPVEPEGGYMHKNQFIKYPSERQKYDAYMERSKTLFPEITSFKKKNLKHVDVNLDKLTSFKPIHGNPLKSHYFKAVHAGITQFDQSTLKKPAERTFDKEMQKEKDRLDKIKARQQSQLGRIKP